jgi:hypothetical protein
LENRVTHKQGMGNNRADFMFKLDKQETDQLVTNCDRFESLKHGISTPYAFTEQGVAMLSSVLRSRRAVEVNIAIMWTFCSSNFLKSIAVWIGGIWIDFWGTGGMTLM